MDKAKNIENELPGTKFIFSDLLEKLAPDIDKQKGKDIADYLIKHDWRGFRMQKKTCLQEETQPEASPKEEKAEPEVIIEPKYQTVGEVLDMMKEKWGDKLPANCLGINAGIWKTQIKHEYLKNLNNNHKNLIK